MPKFYKLYEYFIMNEDKKRRDEILNDCKNIFNEYYQNALKVVKETDHNKFLAFKHWFIHVVAIK